MPRYLPFKADNPFFLGAHDEPLERERGGIYFVNRSSKTFSSKTWNPGVVNRVATHAIERGILHKRGEERSRLSTRFHRG